jgi:Beta propeller domain
MTGLARHRFVAGFAVLTCLVATGCTRDRTDPGVPAGSFQLVFFDSCEQALTGLRTAATAVVGPWGFAQGGVPFGGERDGRVVAPQPANAGAEAPGMAPPPAGDAAKGGTPDYSGTNTHEAGVDEPDLVKTDGKRIVTVSSGRLTVVDASSRRLVGTIDLGENMQGYDADLLLAGDHALVLGNQAAYRDVVVEDSAGTVAKPSDAVTGTSLILVDLAGPRVISRGHADGMIVDARQVGSVARVVVRSYPRLDFPMPQQGTDAERIAANKAIINTSGIDDWLPRLEVTTDGRTTQSRVGCEAVSRPATYSGTNLLTVLSFDLARDALDSGQPVSIVADGDTVYSNGPSLYVASGQAWRVLPMAPGDPQSKPQEPRTEIYKFDTSSASERPRYVAGGSVPGHLLNQYAMSEWDGRLRVASTTDSVMDPGVAPPLSHSGVYVLAQNGEQLVQVGAVEGLGKGERIYSVRFVGPVGYVVTFRQTDPLYTVDLGDPTKPTVRGELKIPGYSAYLHPAGGNRLIGVGQDATDQGSVTGTQVSLFDVGNLADPIRLAKYTLPGTYSEAEFDPHAFLYWPASGLLVVPLQSRYGVAVPVEPNGGPGSSGSGIAPSREFVPASGALVLRLGGSSIAELGFISHPGTVNNGGYPMPIRRSLIIDTTLWTVSAGGLMASDSRSLARLTWIPLA